VVTTQGMLVELLDLERIEVDIFRGRSPDENLQRVFAGQVAEPGPEYQALMPEAPDPETVPVCQERLKEYGDQVPAHWLRPRTVQRRRLAAVPPRVPSGIPGRVDSRAARSSGVTAASSPRSSKKA
jgi:acyl-CoA thioesterase